MRRFIWGALLCFPLALSGATAAPAQDTLRPAAVVNDEVISILDLAMRTRLSVLASGLDNTPEVQNRIASQVLRALIDERLQVQEADRLSISVSDALIEETIDKLASQNGMSRGEFFNFLKRNKVLPSAIADQVSARLLWQRVVSKRLRPSVTISSVEIDEVVNRVRASQGTTQNRISEIFLVVDTVLQEDEIKANATRLVQELRSGGEFAALARQFSQTASGANGGNLGWTRQGQLSEKLNQALSTLEPGAVTGPIRTAGGYYILKLHERRTISIGDTTINLKQVLFALPDGASAAQIQDASAKAEAARQQIKSCSSADTIAKQLGSPGSGDLGSVKLGDLPAATQNAVGSLAIGQPSQPIRLANGISVLIVCDRQDGGIDRDRIEQQLMNQRLEVLARRYLQDLRQSANVDIRI